MKQVTRTRNGPSFAALQEICKAIDNLTAKESVSYNRVFHILGNVVAHILANTRTEAQLSMALECIANGCTAVWQAQAEDQNKMNIH